jgi:hypothetical protein
LKLLFGKQRNHFVQDDNPSSGVFLNRAKNLSLCSQYLITGRKEMNHGR